MESPNYIEETFGILTDDELYIDCIFYKPRNASDEDLRGVRVWVPKYPLTKTSVMICAQQEAHGAGPASKVAHLIFDLRGTGNSDLKDDNFELDINAIRAWAFERFGEKIDISFFGAPTVSSGRVDMTPIRTGVVMEQYVYAAKGMPSNQIILYMSAYGNFGRKDDALCTALSEAGYQVVGIDPLRYLLHASAMDRLTPTDLWADFRKLCQSFVEQPILIAQPIASGLALLWTAGVEIAKGVVAIGRVQVGFTPKHIFKNDNPHTYFISRYVNRIAPRPVGLALDGRAKREDADELATLYQMCGMPRRFEKIEKVNAEFLLEMAKWVQDAGKAD